MIDINKKYRTRDGREVRIYAVDGGGMHPVHGSVLMNNGMNDGWRSATWKTDGRISFLDQTFDLIEVKPRIQRTLWLHIFNSGNIVVSDEPAVCNITHRIACVKVEIDCEEGEGL